jgi:hypothetical protein
MPEEMPEGMKVTTFVVDCPSCKAKVGVKEAGCAEFAMVDEGNVPYAEKISIGNCPKCRAILVGQSLQRRFKDYDSYEDEWSDVVRVFPNPRKTFSSYEIPAVARSSLEEADRCLQAGAHFAACVMLGRALEAVCAHKLLTTEERMAGRRITLADGIKRLRDKAIIDARLFDWSEDLRAVRNLAAHASDTHISREDAEDLQVFAYAIIEYIYDLTERYEEFKSRMATKP